MNESTSNQMPQMKNFAKVLRANPGSYHPGWGGPEYTDWRDEQMSWKQTCYIGDWSFLWNLIVEGPDALTFFSDHTVNSYAGFDIGQGKHAIFCNNNGKVITEGILLRLADQKFAVQSSPAFWTGYLLSKGAYNAKSHQEDWFKYQVQGPNSIRVIEKLTGGSIRDIGFMRFRAIKINDRDALALRQGMAGEIGYELQGHAEYGREIYDAVVEAGQEFGIRRLGRRTAMINHLEASFPTGNWHYLQAMFDPDMLEYQAYRAANFDLKGLSGKLAGSYVSDNISDYYFSPVELGWSKNIKFDHEFTGRKALEAEMANPKRTLVTLEFNSDDVIDIYASYFKDGRPYDFLDMPTQEQWVAWADQVLRNGQLVGISSVPGYSYYFRKYLSLTVVNIEHSRPGTEVEVLWGNPGSPQKKIRATVAPAPYKNDNRRKDVTQLRQ